MKLKTPPTASPEFTLATLTQRDVVYMCVGGEVDIACRDSLDDVVAYVRAAAPAKVLVDVAAVTFAGAELVNFAARLLLALPGTAVMIYRPPGPVRKLLSITSIDLVVGICDELPMGWPPPGTRPDHGWQRWSKAATTPAPMYLAT